MSQSPKLSGPALDALYGNQSGPQELSPSFDPTCEPSNHAIVRSSHFGYIAPPAMGGTDDLDAYFARVDDLAKGGEK